MAHDLTTMLLLQTVRQEAVRHPEDFEDRIPVSRDKNEPHGCPYSRDVQPDAPSGPAAAAPAVATIAARFTHPIGWRELEIADSDEEAGDE